MEGSHQVGFAAKRLPYYLIGARRGGRQELAIAPNDDLLGDGMPGEAAERWPGGGEDGRRDAPPDSFAEAARGAAQRVPAGLIAAQDVGHADEDVGGKALKGREHIDTMLKSNA